MRLLDRWARPRGSWTERAAPARPLGAVECWQASPELPVELMIDLIQRSPPCLWPSQSVPRYGLWHEWPNVQAAHRELMKRFVASLRPYPADEFSGRGIVICAGGWRFFPSVYVTVRMIRHLGCTLPIELWYLGSLNEFDQRMEWILRDYGPITWRDANAVARDKGLEPRHLGSQADGYPPWEIKAFAVLHSAFEEVLSLDADSYPVRQFDFLWDEAKYRKHGCLFWPDRFPHPTDGFWRPFGLGQPGGKAIESGQFLVDKRRTWAAINAAWKLMEHRDYTFRLPGGYGDKDVFALAWVLTRTAHSYLWPTSSFVANTYLQLDGKGQKLFEHRTHNKITLDSKAYFKSRTGSTQYSKLLRHDGMIEGWVKELDVAMSPHKHFRLRPNTTDNAVWDECVTRNEYELPRRLDGEIVLDIGANIGAFTHAALSRGAEFVYCVEPAPSNIPSLQRNLARWRNRVKLIYAAAWRSDVRERYVDLTTLDKSPYGWGTSGDVAVTGISFQGSRHQLATVRAVSLDVLLKAIWRRHRKPIILKIDCEGGEYPILTFTSELEKVSAIYGEYHKVKWRGLRMDQFDLQHVLESNGFSVRLGADADNGHFWATNLRQVPVSS